MATNKDTRGADMDSDVEKKLSDPIIAKQVAFLMYHVCEISDLDEMRALHIVEVLARISQGEKLSSAVLPEKLHHLDMKFSDGVCRTYDEINGFVEI